MLFSLSSEGCQCLIFIAPAVTLAPRLEVMSTDNLIFFSEQSMKKPSSSPDYKKHKKKHREKDKDRHHDKDGSRDKDRNRDRDRDRDRDRRKDRDRDKERSKTHERSRDVEKGKDSLKERDKSQISDRSKEGMKLPGKDCTSTNEGYPRKPPTTITVRIRYRRSYLLFSILF